MCSWCRTPGHNQRSCKEKAAGEQKVEVKNTRTAGGPVAGPSNANNEGSNQSPGEAKTEDDIVFVDEKVISQPQVTESRRGRGSRKNVGARGRGRGRLGGRGRGRGRGRTRATPTEEEPGQEEEEVDELDGIITQELGVVYNEVSETAAIGGEVPGGDPILELSPQVEDKEEDVQVVGETIANDTRAQSVRREQRHGRYNTRRKAALDASQTARGGFKRPRRK